MDQREQKKHKMMTTEFMLDFSERSISSLPGFLDCGKMKTFNLCNKVLEIHSDEKERPLLSSWTGEMITLAVYPCPEGTELMTQEIMYEIAHTTRRASGTYLRPPDRRHEDLHRRVAMDLNTTIVSENLSLVTDTDTSWSLLLSWGKFSPQSHWGSYKSGCRVEFYAHVVRYRCERECGQRPLYRVDRVTCVLCGDPNVVIKTWFYDDDEEEESENEEFSVCQRPRRVTHILEGGRSVCECLHIDMDCTMYIMDGPSGKEKIQKIVDFHDTDVFTMEHAEFDEHRPVKSCTTTGIHRVTGEVFVAEHRREFQGINNISVFTFTEPCGSQTIGDIKTLSFQVPQLGSNEYLILYKTDKGSTSPRVALMQGRMHDNYSFNRAFDCRVTYERTPPPDENDIRISAQIVFRPRDDGSECTFRRFYIYPDNMESCMGAIAKAVVSAVSKKRNVTEDYKDALYRFVENEWDGIVNAKIAPLLPYHVMNTGSFTVTLPCACEFTELSQLSSSEDEDQGHGEGSHGTSCKYSQYVEYRAECDARDQVDVEKHQMWKESMLLEIQADEYADGGADSPFWYAEVDGASGNVFFFKKDNQGRALLRRKVNTDNFHIEYFLGSPVADQGERVVWSYELLPCNMRRITHVGYAVDPCIGNNLNFTRSMFLTLPVYNTASALNTFDASMSWEGEEAIDGMPFRLNGETFKLHKNDACPKIPTDRCQMDLWELFSFPHENRTHLVFTIRDVQGERVEGYIQFSMCDSTLPLEWKITYKRRCEQSNRNAGVQMYGFFKPSRGRLVTAQTSVSAPPDVIAQYKEGEFDEMCAFACENTSCKDHPILGIVESAIQFLVCGKSYVNKIRNKKENDGDVHAEVRVEGKDVIIDVPAQEVVKICRPMTEKQHRVAKGKESQGDVPEQKRRYNKRARDRAKKRERVENTMRMIENVSPEKHHEMTDKCMLCVLKNELNAKTEVLMKLHDHKRQGIRMATGVAWAKARSTKVLYNTFCRMLRWSQASRSMMIAYDSYLRTVAQWQYTSKCNALCNMRSYAKQRNRIKVKMQNLSREIALQTEIDRLVQENRAHEDHKQVLCRQVQLLSSDLKQCRKDLTCANETISEQDCTLVALEQRCGDLCGDLEKRNEELKEHNSSLLTEINQLVQGGTAIMRWDHITCDLGVLKLSYLEELLAVQKTAGIAIEKEVAKRHEDALRADMEEKFKQQIRAQVEQEVKQEMQDQMSQSVSPCESPGSNQVKECAICFKADVESWAMMVPCNHVVLCVDCAIGLSKCPYCSAEATGFARVFL